MELIYDSPDLVALMLKRLAAQESEGAGGFDERMREYLGDLARATGADSSTLLDAAEAESLEVP